MNNNINNTNNWRNCLLRAYSVAGTFFTLSHLILEWGRQILSFHFVNDKTNSERLSNLSKVI